MESISDKRFLTKLHEKSNFSLGFRAYLTLCGWCGKVLLNKKWIDLPKADRLQFRGRYSHAICPKCLEKKFYTNSKEAVKTSSN